MDVNFDFEKIIFENSFMDMQSDHGFNSPKCYKFDLSDQQQSTIDRLINTYGATTTDLTRALTRANIRSLLRESSLIHNPPIKNHVEEDLWIFPA